MKNNNYKDARPGPKVMPHILLCWVIISEVNVDC